MHLVDIPSAAGPSCDLFIWLQTPEIPKSFADYGVVGLVFFIPVAVLWLVFKYGADFWLKIRPVNGHGAKTDAVVAGLARVESQLGILTTQVGRLCDSYHDRLIPTLSLMAITQARQQGLHQAATEHEKRLAEVIAKEEQEGAPGKQEMKRQ